MLLVVVSAGQILIKFERTLTTSLDSTDGYALNEVKDRTEGSRMIIIHNAQAQHCCCE